MAAGARLLRILLPDFGGRHGLGGDSHAPARRTRDDGDHLPLLHLRHLLLLLLFLLLLQRGVRCHAAPEADSLGVVLGDVVDNKLRSGTQSAPRDARARSELATLFRECPRCRGAGVCLVRIVRLADADVLEQLVEQLIDALGRQVLLDRLALCFRHRRAN